MDQRREDAIRNYLAIMPTAEAFIPAMVDAFDVAGQRRQRLIEVLAGGTFISILEQKHRAALAGLSTEDLEAITALFATQPSSSRSRLLMWGSAMAWAARELIVYIEGEYDRLLREAQPER
jgi:hypothetical protein